MKRILAAILTLVGCAPTTYDHGIPNLYEVRAGVWRGGQPTTDEHWAYIESLGVKTVVKLNFETEGSDDGARAIGLDVHVLSIQPAGDKDIFDNIANTFVQPDPTIIAEAERIILLGGGVLVHCTHGQDRTGLVVGISRLLFDAWNKERAWNEMLEYHFHPELLGLTGFWLEY